MPVVGPRLRRTLRGVGRFALALAVWLSLVATAVVLGEEVRGWMAATFGRIDPAALNLAITVTLLVFMLAAAIPFVPGAEIGLALLILCGAEVAVQVWAAMVAALSLAYAAGRAAPLARVAAGLGRLGLRRAADLAARLARVEAADRLDLLLALAPPGWAPALLRRRHPVLALALNLPGNSVAGGGGGLAFLAGASGLYRFPAFLATVALAAAPIPAAFLIAAALRMPAPM